MLGMNFASFLILTVIGAIAAVVSHYGFRYRFLQGIDSVMGKLIFGWVGAWIGSPVLGHWLWKYENVYFVPALLGAFAVVHLNVLLWKAMAKLTMPRMMAQEEPPRPRAAAA